MREYVITTDNNADLPPEFYKENNMDVLQLSFSINDEIYDGIEKTMTSKEFYDAMRDGAMPVTQQVNPENSKIFFTKVLEKDLDIIHISFTSGLSGTYSSTTLGANEAMEDYPESKITVIDSLCASVGQGLLVYEAVKRMNAGMGYDELVKWIEDNKLRLVHDVVADDLYHLQRGGRVSKTTAVLGSTLGVKPIIYLNDEGKLISYSKQRHKKGGLKFLVANLGKNIKTDDNLNTLGICHSDCINDVETLKKMIQEKTGIDKFIVGDIGPTIGAHTGIGTIALFYFSDNRDVAK